MVIVMMIAILMASSNKFQVLFQFRVGTEPKPLQYSIFHQKSKLFLKPWVFG
jgi:hypothetical protein